MTSPSPCIKQPPSDLRIRHAQEGDLPAIFRIYEIARQTMRDNGNPTQWGDEWPPEDMVRNDIVEQLSYVVEGPRGVQGVFALVLGDDPTYALIEDGAWPNDEPYATIHRIASDGTSHGTFAAAVDYALQQCANVRIDTHADNSIMRHCIAKAGFEYCGIIYHTDGTPRLAYQLQQRR